MRWQLDLSPVPTRSAPTLDQDQSRVVSHRSGPLLVLAGPGTGKTTTIVEAVAARLQDPVDPLPASAVLALTFGRRAAGELRDRVASRLGGGLLPQVATFHSFAYGLLALTASREPGLDLPRLMSGAEEDVRIRELLVGAVAEGSINWPDDLAGALHTLGLANEVRAVIARSRELGLEPAALRRIGASAGRPAWSAIAQLAVQEREVMLLENVMDYTELLRLAVLRAREPHVRDFLHTTYRAVFVDEYQDTDPLQVQLLEALVGPACSIVAVGDHDQAIYGFRGADVRGLLQFPEQFRTRTGEPAPVVALRHARRFGPQIRSTAALVLGDRLVPGLPVEVQRAHRAPECTSPTDPQHDAVSLHMYDSRGAQAMHVAREVRIAHLERQVPWSELAVIVRSGQQIPALQRALAGAGVPVAVAQDEIPLKDEPAVSALLAVLAVAAKPASATSTQILDILTGPIIGLEASDARRLGRALRAQNHEVGFATPPSGDLIRALVLDDPAPLAPLDATDPAIEAVTLLRTLVLDVRAELTHGRSPEEVLWTLWTGGRAPHGWPERLRMSALHGSRSASHDIDAVMALFASAERLSGRYPGFLGARMFLDVLQEQQIPSEAVGERDIHHDAVRILTAHRAKGLEWNEVWVVGAEDGRWPDLRLRGSTLHADQLTVDGLGPGSVPADILVEERRLFYVACTRARHHLHVSAVDEGDDGDERPSLFITEWLRAGVVAQSIPGRPSHAVTLSGLVAELRVAAADPASSPRRREAALARLAQLAAQCDDSGAPLVPQADPDQWWGVAERTQGAEPIADPIRPVHMSGSRLDSLLNCPLRYFLTNVAHAEVPRAAATAFGSVVHAIADYVAKGEVPASMPAMDAEVDRVWSALRYESAWQTAAERGEASEALRRFLAYHDRADRALVDTEVSMEATLEVPLPNGGTEPVHISGYLDRIERDMSGDLVAIDLKSTRTKPSGAELAEHGQLGLYQLMIRSGAYSADAESAPGGAALVQLRMNESKKDDGPKVQMQEALTSEPPTWVENRLGQAVAVIRSEEFPAVRCKECRYCAFHSVCPAQSEGGVINP